MVRRKVSQRRLKKFSTGDLRDRITTHVRFITPGTFDDAKFSETYDAGIERWASVTTVSTQASPGISQFGGISLPEGTSHVFVIRFDPEITSENVIRWEGIAYKILDTNDPDERNEYLELFAQVLGDKTLAANT